jgi:raffinose synthase
VDGAKVDVHSGVSATGDGVGGGPHIGKLYTTVMEKSVSKRFPAENGAANCINYCMFHSTENLYRHKVTSAAKDSEFFSDRPESHAVHLVNVAYNSLFIGEICLPDWDMFHSLHESAELHGDCCTGYWWLPGVRAG